MIGLSKAPKNVLHEVNYMNVCRESEDLDLDEDEPSGFPIIEVSGM